MLFFFRRFSPLWLLVLAITPLAAQDKITLTTGREESGQVVRVQNGNVVLSSGGAQLTFPLAQIKSVDMAPPAALASLKTATTDKAKLDILAPLVTAYKGLPANWVVDAMGQMAESYTNLNQIDQAAGVYKDIAQLYPNSVYLTKAKAGDARIALLKGNADEALTILAPLIEQANKQENLVPSPADGRVFADAFIVQGQALEKKGKNPEALECYLTVVTAFYQNPTAVKTAQDLADALRKKVPGLTVP